MTLSARLCAIIAYVVTAASLVVLAGDPPYAQWPMPSYAPLIPNGRRGMNPPEEFGIFYSLWAEQPQWFNVNPGQVPFRQDIILVPATTAWLYPRQGPHKIETYPGGRQAFYNNFIPQLTAYIAGQVTVPNYQELLILDFEWFCPWWTGHFNWASPEGPEYVDADPIDDWRDTLRVTRADAIRGMTPAQQEAYFKQEWLATTREFFERSINAARAVCPNAKIGIYNQPTQTYWDWRNPAKALNLRIGHDEVPWFWEMVDVIVPSLYSFYKSVPNDQVVANGTGRDHEADFELYLRNNISEALRVAGTKPVYPYVSFVYHMSNVAFANQPCNGFNLRRPYEIAREMGCNGAAVWGWFRSQAEYDLQAPYFNNTVVPFLTEFSLLPALPRTVNRCIPDLGSQGGSSGSDGELDQNDFVSFVDQYFANNYRADVGSQGGVVGPDGTLNNNDFVVFINLFMNGCGIR